MGRENTVIGCMIGGNVRDLLRQACGELKILLYETNCSTDLIAIPSMLSVVDPSAMEPRDLADVLDWVTDLEDPQYRILFTEAVTGLSNRLSRNVIAAPACWSYDHFKFLLLKLRAAARRRAHECRTYDRKLFRLVYVLREFHSKKKVNTRELANAFNVSIRAYSGPNRPPIPGQIVHPFRLNSSTHSGANRPLIPAQIVHRFRVSVR